jgi:hypothetical protein
VLYEEVAVLGLQNTVLHPLNSLTNPVFVETKDEDLAFYHASKKACAKKLEL